MAAPFIIGALKIAGKKIFKELAEEAIKSAVKGVGKELGLDMAKKYLSLSRKGLSDIEAVILNRVKSYPDKVMKDFLSNELGLPINEVNKVIGKFKQTERMLQGAKGKNFTDLLGKATFNQKKNGKQQFGAHPDESIKKSKRKIMEHNAKTEKEKNRDNKNWLVKAALSYLQAELEWKFMGIYGAKQKAIGNKYSDYHYTRGLNIMKYFNNKAQYDNSHLIALESVKDMVTGDLEYGGSTGFLIDYGHGYVFINEENANNLLAEIHDTVKQALSI